MSKNGLPKRVAASVALNSNEENAASAARVGAQFDAADAARYAAHRPAGLSLS